MKHKKNVNRSAVGVKKGLRKEEKEFLLTHL